MSVKAGTVMQVLTHLDTHTEEINGDACIQGKSEVCMYDFHALTTYINAY